MSPAVNGHTLDRSEKQIREDVVRVKGPLLETLDESDEPLGLRQLVQKTEERGCGISSVIAHQAVWDMIEEGDMEFTPDSRLKTAE